MSTAEQTISTPDDLLTLPGGEHFELVDGELVEKDMGAESDWISMKINRLLGYFVDQHRLGDVFGPETGYQCFPGSPRTVRKPDGSFIAKGRLPGEKIPKGHITIAPDLAIEVISPNDTYYGVEAKVRLFLEAGIRLIWVINPDNRTVKVYAANQPSATDLTTADTLDGGDVLPQFSVPVADLFPRQND